MSANFGILSEKFRPNLGKIWFKYLSVCPRACVRACVHAFARRDSARLLVKRAGVQRFAGLRDICHSRLCMHSIYSEIICIKCVCVCVFIIYTYVGGQARTNVGGAACALKGGVTSAELLVRSRGELGAGTARRWEWGGGGGEVTQHQGVGWG